MLRPHMTNAAEQQPPSMKRNVDRKDPTFGQGIEHLRSKAEGVVQLDGGKKERRCGEAWEVWKAQRR